MMEAYSTECIFCKHEAHIYDERQQARCLNPKCRKTFSLKNNPQPVSAFGNQEEWDTASASPVTLPIR